MQRLDEMRVIFVRMKAEKHIDCDEVAFEDDTKTWIKHDVDDVDHVPCLLRVSNSTFPLTSNLYSSWLLLLEANAMPRWNFRFNWEKGAFF